MMDYLTYGLFWDGFTRSASLELIAYNSIASVLIRTRIDLLFTSTAVEVRAARTIPFLSPMLQKKPGPGSFCVEAQGISSLPIAPAAACFSTRRVFLACSSLLRSYRPCAL